MDFSGVVVVVLAFFGGFVGDGDGGALRFGVLGFGVLWVMGFVGESLSGCVVV